MTTPRLTLPKPGTYIIAVSGGVDSIVLLDLLAGRKEYSLVVATVNHGWRDDSDYDVALVERLAIKHGLPCIAGRLVLPDRSEATARMYRYAFLRHVAKDHGAHGILLAHHADDIRETVVLNAQRGAGRHGLTPMQDDTGLVRPLRTATKAEIIAYAHTQGLEWREDSSNTNTEYRRNNVRINVLPASSNAQLTALNSSVMALHKLNPAIDQLLHAEIDGRELTELSTEWLRCYSLATRRHLLVTLIKQSEPHIQLRREHIERLALDIGNQIQHSHFRLSDALSATLQRDKLVLTRDHSVPVQ